MSRRELDGGEMRGFVVVVVRRTLGLALVAWGAWSTWGAAIAAMVVGGLLLLPPRRRGGQA